MKSVGRTLWAVVAGLALTGSVCGGGTLSLDRVPSTAKWVMHLDLAGMQQTQLGQAVVAMLNEDGLEVKLQAVEQMFSIHLLNDIQDVTLCGPDGRRERALVYVHGAPDQEAVLRILRANDEYTATTYRTHTIHQWRDADRKAGDDASPVTGRTVYGCFCGADTVLMGGELAAVQKALDVIDGVAPSLAQQATFAEWTSSANGFFFLAMAAGLQGMEAAHPKAAMLQQVEDAFLSLDEDAEFLNIRMILTAQDAAAATKMQQMMQGLVAFALISAEDNPTAAEFAQAVNMTAAGNVLTVTADWPVQQVITALREERQRKKSVLDDVSP